MLWSTAENRVQLKQFRSQNNSTIYGSRPGYILYKFCIEWWWLKVVYVEIWEVAYLFSSNWRAR